MRGFQNETRLQRLSEVGFIMTGSVLIRLPDAVQHQWRAVREPEAFAFKRTLCLLLIYQHSCGSALVWSWKLLIPIHVAPPPTNSDISLIFPVTYKVLLAAEVIFKHFEKLPALMLILWWKKRKRGFIFRLLSLWTWFLYLENLLFQVRDPRPAPG